MGYLCPKTGKSISEKQVYELIKKKNYKVYWTKWGYRNDITKKTLQLIKYKQKMTH